MENKASTLNHVQSLKALGPWLEKVEKKSLPAEFTNHHFNTKFLKELTAELSKKVTLVSVEMYCLSHADRLALEFLKDLAAQLSYWYNLESPDAEE